MTPWLLKNEGYPPAIVVSVLLHVVLLVVIFLLNRDRHEIRVEPPLAIQATTTKDNPQKMRRSERLAAQRVQDQQRQQNEEANRKAEVEKFQQDLQAKQEAERKLKTQQQQAQDQKLKQEQDAEKKRLEAREQDLRKQKQKEADNRVKAQQEIDLAFDQVAAKQALTEEQQLIAQYKAYIQSLVIREWRRPPNARNGMQAVVEIRLVPTGEIVSSRIVQSSGDGLFDDSVLQAVKKVESFPELQKLSSQSMKLFENNFRQINLVFRPEDLLR